MGRMLRIQLLLRCANLAAVQCWRNSVTPNSPHLGEITLQQDTGDISVMHLRYAPELRLPTHAHERASFVWIQSGGQAEAFGRRVLQLRQRQVLFRPAGEEHSDHFLPVETW